MNLSVQLLFLLAVCGLSQAGRILVYSPSLTPSHLISNARIADTLADAGHQVTLLILEYMPIVGFSPSGKSKVITISNISSRFEEDMEGADEYMLKNERLGFLERTYFEFSLTAMCEAVMKKKHELEEIRKMNFEIAFSEQVDLCGVGVIRYLGIQNHIWISTTPIMDAVSYNLGVPAPPSYVPTIEENDNGDEMGFWQRVFNHYMYIGSIIVHRIGTDGSTTAIRKHSPSLPNIRDIAANSSLCFVYSDEILDFARPILHKTIYIGGLGVKEPKPLDAKFSSIMAKGKEGVVIISLGSIVPFGSFPAEVIGGVAKVIKEMSAYHFIIKINKGDKKTAEYFKGISNYDFVEWMPQSDMLAHPRLKLFITHGGINGLIEAALRAVPLLVVPVFADQFRNARMAEKRGIGKVLRKLEISEDTFRNAVQTVLKDDGYKKRAERMSQMMLSKPFSPEERLVRWTEFALQHGVLEEFKPAGASMHWLVYFNMDVIAFCTLASFLLLYTIFIGVKKIFCRRNAPTKQKLN